MQCLQPLLERCVPAYHSVETIESRVRVMEEALQSQSMEAAAATEVARAVRMAEDAIKAAQADAKLEVQRIREDAERRIAALELSAVQRIAAAEERLAAVQRERAASPPAVSTGGGGASLPAKLTPEVEQEEEAASPPPSTPTRLAAVATEDRADAASPTPPLRASSPRAPAPPATPPAKPAPAADVTAAPPVECLRQLGCTCRACSVSLLEAQGPTAEAEPAQRRRTLGARRAGVRLLFEPIQR